MTIEVCARCGAKNRVNAGAAAAEGRQAVCGRCGAKLGGASGSSGGVRDASAERVRAEASKPLTVTDASFERDVLRAAEGIPVLVDFWAAWCGPCRVVAPALDQLAAESGGRYLIAKLNVDENPQTAARFQIQSIPTMLIFKNGQLVDRAIGAQPKQALAARLAGHI